MTRSWFIISFKSVDDEVHGKILMILRVSRIKEDDKLFFCIFLYIHLRLCALEFHYGYEFELKRMPVFQQIYMFIRCPGVFINIISYFHKFILQVHNATVKHCAPLRIHNTYIKQ